MRHRRALSLRGGGTAQAPVVESHYLHFTGGGSIALPALPSLAKIRWTIQLRTTSSAEMLAFNATSGSNSSQVYLELNRSGTGAHVVGYLRAFVQNTNASGAKPLSYQASINDGSWHEVAVEVDLGGGYIHLLLEDSVVASASIGAGYITALTDGTVISPANLLITGDIRYVRIDVDDETWGEYGFDEGSGTTLGDSSSNNHDGTISGSATWETE